MPYLQLDVCGHYPADTKRTLAGRLAETYAETMAMDIRRISIAIRELGEAGLWRIVDGEPVPAHVLMCDIRRGRDAELRLRLAQQLVAICAATLGIDEHRLNVEFTQHAGDEMYHPMLGGFSPEWADSSEQDAPG
ncbi:tautomerase [Salinisphaera sp. T31B1]|uniref:tautomerase n=1 Tax=Salinisphaera sp. T31B1 TaxID=727963 RepID=UPI003341E169